MRLPHPFLQLPLLFDVARLQTEVAALPPEAWVPHPDRLPGNSAAPLIGPGGIETESLQGEMRPTRWLGAMPYARQILAGFGVVWSRSRLMRLEAGAEVPDHADINHHWHTRVRVHIPVTTWPEVRFHCGGEAVHMAAGEAWIFDNWRRHRVENNAARERIHLVADTTGTAAFWDFAKAPAPPREHWRTLAWDPERDVQPMTEANQRSAVMPAAEVQLLTSDLCSELTASAGTAEMRGRVARFSRLLESFVHDWRQLCMLHGTGGRGHPEFRRLAGAVHNAAKPLAEGLAMRTNGVRALHVLEARVLKHLVPEDAAPQAAADPHRPIRINHPKCQDRVIRSDRLLENPVFIVAAPRSGSTLLFETLACSAAFNSFGGEAHGLVESLEALRPGAPGLDSNRLTAAHATPEIIATIRQAAIHGLQGPEGRPPLESAPLLEKTPKNSLRVAFLNKVFPGARFILLWREARENLGSIMEAWRSGGWITYASLPDWDGPWSLLLPPEWRSLRGAPPAAIAARQWQSANDIALDDLQQVPRDRWTAVRHHDFLADPAATVRRLCEFIEVPFDLTLQARTAGVLPLSRSTQTPPMPGKWRSNEAAIERVLPGLETCRQRLRALA